MGMDRKNTQAAYVPGRVYTILSCLEKEQLINKVNEYLDNGWVLVGAPFISPNECWCQAVVKETMKFA